VQRITAEGAVSNKELQKKLSDAMRSVTRCCSQNSKHYSTQSAACDYTRMPRELLPRCGGNQTQSPATWPYLRQTTVIDVRAIRCIRSERLRAPYTAMWHTLQQRLEQYAATGAGTVAEAIVYNDYWWNGQLAHEEPSGGKSKAVKRRRSSGC
jgi:hypothetical protein